MSESLMDQIIGAIGEAARYGDIHGDGDGNASMSSEAWFVLRSHLPAILAAAHAKGRAEGIGEAVEIVDAKADFWARNGFPMRSTESHRCARALRALLPTTGGSDADAKR